MDYESYIEKKRLEIAVDRKQKVEEAKKASSPKKENEDKSDDVGVVFKFYEIVDNSIDVVAEAFCGKMEILKNQELKATFIQTMKTKPKAKSSKSKSQKSTQKPTTQNKKSK